MAEDIPKQSKKKNLVMICGEPTMGKSVSLMNLENPEKTLYLNCEGKELPFRSKFKEKAIYDPLVVNQYFEKAGANGFEKIIVESQTFLMELFVSTKIIGSTDGRGAWMDYAEFFKKLMLHKVPQFPGDVIFTAHQETIRNETEKVMEKKIPVQGSLKKKGIEAYFTTMVTAKKMLIEDLEDYENDLLVITDMDRAMGIKHVFQTILTPETINEKGIRSPMGMWDIKETFIDNDCNKLFKRLKEYYK